MTRLYKQNIVDALTAAKVDFPSGATISQLRALYKECINPEVEVTEATEEPTDEKTAAAPELNDSKLLVSSKGAPMGKGATAANEVPDAIVTSTAISAASSAVTAAVTAVKSDATKPFDLSAVVAVDAPVFADAEVSAVTAIPAAITAVGLPPTTAVNMSTDIRSEPAVYAYHHLEAQMDSSEASQLEEQLRILRMRREILELQRQINAIELNEEPTRRRRVNFEELDAAVPKFSGDDHYDVIKWFEQFDNFTDTCGYSAKEKCQAVRRCIEGTAKQYVLNLGLVAYDEMKSGLVNMFKRTITRQEIYRQLRARVLKSNESCLSYVIAMQSIAAKTDIEEQELVDIIIDGIPDSSNGITMLYGANSIDDLVRRMDRYEQRRSRATKPNIIAVTKSKITAAAAAAVPMVNKGEIRCFNCSQFGHYQSACPKPTRPPGSCFTCHKMGHLHNVCPMKERKGLHTVASLSTNEALNDDDDMDHVLFKEKSN